MNRPRIRDLWWLRLFTVGALVAVSGPVALAIDVARGIHEPAGFAIYAVLWVIVTVSLVWYVRLPVRTKTERTARDA